MTNLNQKTQKLDINGRSLILNLTFIVLNLVGVFFVVKGFHISSGESAGIYKIIGFSLVLISIFVLILLKGLFLFSYFARALVGGLFIVSGLIKANDPWGFAFKLEEYFAADGLSYDFPFFEQFAPYSLQLSMLICVVEIVLGVAVIVGGKIKLTSWALVFMMAFFTWLTWYTTSCIIQQELAMSAKPLVDFNRQCVADCGCFGDALKGSVGRSLTPVESFWKDIVLFYFVLIIFVNQWRIKENQVKENWIMVPSSIIVIIFFSWVFGWMFPIFFAIFVILGAFVVGNLNIGSMAKAWKMAIFVGLVSFIFTLYTSMYLPIKDYRPYAIGNNIREQMNLGVPGVSEFQWLYTNKATGQIDTFATDEWAIYSDTNKYKYSDRVEKIIVEQIDAPITDFLVGIDYEFLTDEQKAIPYIDSLIKADYDSYYEDRMALKTQWGNDTIAVMDYDTLYYPDSIYSVINTFTTLMDPSKPFWLDLTNYVLDEEAIFVMTMRDIKTVGKDELADIKLVYEKSKELGIPFVVLTPATQDEIAKFKVDNGFDPLFLTIDGIEVKIIIRSNPGLLLLKKATVVNMWPWRSVPDFEDIFEEHLQTK